MNKVTEPMKTGNAELGGRIIMPPVGTYKSDETACRRLAGTEYYGFCRRGQTAAG